MSEQVHENVRLHELLNYVREGKNIEAMQEFYSANVVMEDPAVGAVRGLEENIKRERQFLDTVREFRNFLVPHIATGPNTAIYENYMDWIDIDGKEHHVEQVAVQTWKNGKIVHERFYYHA